MRITHIAAGAGGMYCGACARDLALVRALIARGHDVRLVPLYTPLRTETGAPPRVAPVFYGGVNVFLQQASGLFGHLPSAVGRVLDHPGLLQWVSQFAIETKPEHLGPMTVSVLAGEDGRQRKELRRLLAYLERDVRPAVVSITNSLLSGIAPAVKERLGVPVVCGVQGEDSFVQAMPEPHRSEAQGWMRRRARSIDLFVSPGEAYARRMAGFLGVAQEKVAVVRPGFDVQAYRRPVPRPREPFTVGYLSVITPGKGLDLLVEAVAALVQAGRDIRLRIAGKPLDRRYWESVRARIESGKLSDRVDYVGEVDFAGKLSFLGQCSAFCVPSRYEEARGMACLEAMAHGVPAVLPEAGIFPEVAALAGGGILVPPGSPAALAQALAGLMDDPDGADSLGRAGAEGMRAHFTAEAAADALLGQIERLAGANRRG